METNSSADTTKSISIRSKSVTKTKITWFSTALTKTLSRSGFVDRAGRVEAYSSADATNSITIRRESITKISGFGTTLTKTLGRSGFIDRPSWVKTNSSTDTTNTISISIPKTKISWLSTTLATTSVTGGGTVGSSN